MFSKINKSEKRELHLFMYCIQKFVKQHLLFLFTKSLYWKMHAKYNKKLIVCI